MWSRGLDSFGYNNKPHLVFGLSYHPAELSNVSEPSPQWVTGFWTPHIGACWAFYDTLSSLRFSFQVWRYIPHSFSPAGPYGRCADAQDAQAPFYSSVPPGLYLTQTHTHTHLFTHVYTVSPNIPRTSFFDIYCLQFDKKKCII